jgi:hypothetical protein
VKKAIVTDSQLAPAIAFDGRSSAGLRACLERIRFLDYPDVSANSVIMAALGGGRPEKHKVFQVMTGWPGQARPSSGAKIRQCFYGFFC